MAEEEPILTDPPTPDVAAHVRDYSHFVQILKWGALISLIIALFVMMIIS